MQLSTLVSQLRQQAIATNERRLLVLAGDRAVGLDAVDCVIEAAGVGSAAASTTDNSAAEAAGVDSAADATTDSSAVRVITSAEEWSGDSVHPNQAAELLGTSCEIAVYDCHEAFDVNALGQITGAVTGGGLLVLLLPPLKAVPESLTALVDQVAVPPYERGDVGNRFRQRLVNTLQTHPGIAIARLPEQAAVDDVEDAPGSASDEADSFSVTLERDGGIAAPTPQSAAQANSEPQPPIQNSSDPHVYTDTLLPTEAYEACLTRDQSRAVARLAALATAGNAVVVEADRGRGKSSAAGLAAAGLAAAGHDLLVTAPGVDNTGPLFERAGELLRTLGCLDSDNHTAADSQPLMTTTAGGRIRYAEPRTAATLPDSPTAVIVDEAAALPVQLLEQFLSAPSVGFCTTVHGYEGSGRGFGIRFRERLADSEKQVQRVELTEPIRYARDDPVESWLAWTLMLDAEPPATQAVTDATPETVEYRQLTSDELADDESLLRAVFGLLVAAHYRTEPADLVRLLDAPNLTLRVLSINDNPVSVALLAREGGLSAETEAASYRGRHIQGNMIPDLLTSQLRDPDAGTPTGYRVMRIATHHAVRSRGLGSLLLANCKAELGDSVDWFGVGFGATPRLLAFWRDNGYRTVHLSVTPNAKSGTHSAIMLSPTSAVGEELTTRHVRWFCNRVPGQLADSLSSLDPAVVRQALSAATLPAQSAEPSIAARGWRLLAGVADGPGTYEAAPHLFRELTMWHLLASGARLSTTQQRLLIRKVLQGWSWADTASDCGFNTASQCRREMSEIARQFCAALDNETLAAERRRYEE